MMLLFFICELTILSFLARWVTSQMYLLFLLLFRARSVALSLTTSILFPGTVVHELSHLFVAEILGVHTGTLTLIPEAIEGKSEEVRSGSVAIAQTGPIRRTVIGIAPVAVGTLAITLLSYLLSQPVAGLFAIFHITITQWQSILIQAIFYYLLFAVSNTMFSSPEDLKGAVPVFLTILVFGLAGYLLGLRFTLTGQARYVVVTALDALTHSLGIVLAVNGVILLVIKILIVGVGKIMKLTTVPPQK